MEGLDAQDFRNGRDLQLMQNPIPPFSQFQFRYNLSLRGDNAAKALSPTSFSPIFFKLSPRNIKTV